MWRRDDIDAPPQNAVVMCVVFPYTFMAGCVAWALVAVIETVLRMRGSLGDRTNRWFSMPRVLQDDKKARAYQPFVLEKPTRICLPAVVHKQPAIETDKPAGGVALASFHENLPGLHETPPPDDGVRPVEMLSSEGPLTHH